MTRRGRKIGAILALVAGGIFVFFFIMQIFMFISYPDVMVFAGLILFLIGAVLTILGGILLLLDKWIGGFFPILIGVTFLLFFFCPCTNTHGHRDPSHNYRHGF